MAKADVINYSALANVGNPFTRQHSNNANEENPFVLQQQQQHRNEDDEELGSDDNDDMAQHSGIMIHVVPDTSKSINN